MNILRICNLGEIDMDELKQCTVRFNMENPIHQKAWEYLQNRDKKKYTSYSNLIADAA